MKTNGQLSERQQRILDFVRRYKAKNGLAPTVRDIRDGAGISSNSVTAYNLRKLEQAGCLRLLGDKSRGIILPEETRDAAGLRAVLEDHADNLDLLAAEVYDMDRDTLHRALTARAESLRAALQTVGASV